MCLTVVCACIAFSRHFHRSGCNAVFLADFSSIIALTRNGYGIFTSVCSALVGEGIVGVEYQIGLSILHGNRCWLLVLAVKCEALRRQGDGHIGDGLLVDDHIL